MLVDSHCHLDRVSLAPYDDDFSSLMSTTLAKGVDHLLCVSIDLESWPAMVALVEDYPQISISVGVHPNDKERCEPTVETLLALSQNDKVVAIGETGLDYFHGEGDLDWQRERFREHIRAARAADLPLIIHTRDARSDTLRIMQDEGASEVSGVMHCFTEDWPMAEQALAMGFHISFSGIITFKNAAKLREVVKQVPMERILVETDSPYLAPVPYRGKSNQPIYVRHVAQCVAELKGVSLEAIAQQTTANFYRCFPKAGSGRK
jgi:TatD DNase family protein